MQWDDMASPIEQRGVFWRPEALAKKSPSSFPTGSTDRVLGKAHRTRAIFCEELADCNRKRLVAERPQYSYCDLNSTKMVAVGMREGCREHSNVGSDRRVANWLHGKEKRGWELPLPCPFWANGLASHLAGKKSKQSKGSSANPHQWFMLV